MPLIYMDDLRLNAVVDGPANAPPLVLIHALGTDLSIWDGVVARLPRHRILRLDLRGHGQSDCPPPPYAMGALIRDVERLMAHVGMAEAVVVGVSLGGLMAQGLAVKRLDLVRGMVLSNTAAKIGGAAMWKARIAQVQDEGLAAYARGAMERIFGRNWRQAPEMPRIRALLEGTPPEGWIGCAEAIAGTDFYTTTANLTLPTLVIAGANDGTTPPDLVRETAELIRGHRWALMRGAGHLPMVERPGDYAELLGDFLASIGHG
jgi:3-oxoadipate enol-lactonase